MKKFLIAGAACLFLSTPALAATGVTIQGPNGSQATVDNNGLHTVCTSGCSSHDSNPATSGPTIAFQAVVTTSAATLPSHTFTNGFVLTALSTNIAAICIGGTGVTISTGYCIQPGQSSPGIGGNNSNLTDIVGSNTSDAVQGLGN